MDDSTERFLRNAHIFARLVEQILEHGYLHRSSNGTATFDQLNILKFLDRPGVRLVKDVAHFLNASYAAASKAVSRLQKKGWVATSADSHDHRALRVAVTPAARSLIRKYERLKLSRLRKMTTGEDIDRLSKTLEVAIAALMKERSMAGNPCLGCGAYYAKECVVRAHGQSCTCR